MAVKRGSSGLSLIVGVNKPSGMTSHDVVNRCRRIFSEKRVGHTGTLDPLASGVLPIAIGPATRLGNYLSTHNKSYKVAIAFGSATDTDDKEGHIIRQGAIPDMLRDSDFAASFVEHLIGSSKQLPPAYSAIKVHGEKSYRAARKGRIIELKPRDIEVFSASFLGLRQSNDATLYWDVAFTVSKGTYIRALARDIGNSLGCPAHVDSLERTSSGALCLDECVSLEALEDLGIRAAIDPLPLLGMRFCLLSENQAQSVAHGASLANRTLTLFELPSVPLAQQLCACTSGIRQSTEPLYDGEMVALVQEKRLQALYQYNQAQNRFIPRCVFEKGVLRGCSDL